MGGIKENRRIEDDRCIGNRLTRLGTLSKDHVLTLRTGQRDGHRARALAVAIAGQIPERVIQLIQKNSDLVMRCKPLASNRDFLVGTHSVSRHANGRCGSGSVCLRNPIIRESKAGHHQKSGDQQEGRAAYQCFHCFHSSFQENGSTGHSTKMGPRWKRDTRYIDVCKLFI